MYKDIIEVMLENEITDHLGYKKIGYKKSERKLKSNSRNGKRMAS